MRSTETDTPSRSRRYDAERHARLRASGTCTACRAVPADEGKAQCSPCRERRNARERERRRDRTGYSSAYYHANRDKYRDWRYRRRYGITLAEFTAMLAAQGGGCAICRRPEGREGQELFIDHDHTTGIVRGLLCTSCNRALDLLRDDPDRAEAAARYLRRAPNGDVTP